MPLVPLNATDSQGVWLIIKAHIVLALAALPVAVSITYVTGAEGAVAAFASGGAVNRHPLCAKCRSRHEYGVHFYFVPDEWIAALRRTDPYDHAPLDLDWDEPDFVEVETGEALLAELAHASGYKTSAMLN